MGVMKIPRFFPWVLSIQLACFALSAHAQESLLKKATFCHGLKEDQSPKEPAEFFRNDETVYLSIELKGRPKSGVVAAQFLFRDELLVEAQVDVATVNKGVVFSIGQNTFVGFNITHKEPLPVGDCYVADVTFDDQPLGKFPFKIAPPKDAIPSKITRVTLAKGADEDQRAVDETREFDGTEKVVLVGVGNLGLASWLEASWKVGGKVDDMGTRSFTMKENKNDVPFSFSFVPAGGWPAGTHEVTLVLDGQEVATEKFTVKVGAPMAGKTKLELDASQLFQDDGNGDTGKEVTAFATGDTVFHARWNLKEEALAKGVQFVWVLVEAEGEKEQVIATADIEPGVSDQITSSLTTKNGLPVGKYRIDLLQDGKLLDSKPFEVK